MDDSRRKPPNMSFPDWVELQVRQAEDDGAFDDLPGAGKPIAGLGRPHDDMAWIASYLRRENVDVGDVLPPGLRLAKEVETLDDRLAAISSEPKVRSVIDDLNRRIDEAYARPQVGPPLRVKKVAVEPALERWRASRPPSPIPTPAPQLQTARRPKRWLRRRGPR